MNSNRRATLIWILLVGSALALSLLAVALIHKQNLRQRSAAEALLASESERLNSHLEAYFQEIRNETARQLISFHQEGLANQLRRWQASNALISKAAVISSDHPTATAALANPTESISLEDPDTPSVFRGGYYQENREIELYEHGQVEPILLWFRSGLGERGLTWTAFHRIVPEGALRYARLDRETLLASFSELLAELSGPSIFANIQSGPHPAAETQNSRPLDWLGSGYSLDLTLNSKTANGDWLGNFGYLMVAVCLSLCGVSATLLARQTIRERREALRKTSFVSQISHEFKTPLTSITLYADLLGEQDLPDSKRIRYLDTISRESQRLTELVDNLLGLSALEQGKRSYHIETLDLRTTISNTLIDYQPTLSQSGMDVSWDPPKEPVAAQADRNVVRQTLINLLDNARKYAGSESPVQIDLQSNGSASFIRVTDRGPGIPVEHSQRIFESFYQERSLLEDKSPGFGLGLSISRRMLRDCQGDLYLDSSYEEGARFVMQFSTAP